MPKASARTATSRGAGRARARERGTGRAGQVKREGSAAEYLSSSWDVRSKREGHHLGCISSTCRPFGTCRVQQRAPNRHCWRPASLQRVLQRSRGRARAASANRSQDLRPALLTGPPAPFVSPEDACMSVARACTVTMCRQRRRRQAPAGRCQRAAHACQSALKRFAAPRLRLQGT